MGFVQLCLFTRHSKGEAQCTPNPASCAASRFAMHYLGSFLLTVGTVSFAAGAASRPQRQ